MFSIIQIILWSSTNTEWSLHHRKEQPLAKRPKKLFLHQILRGSRQHFLETNKTRKEILLVSLDWLPHVSQLMHAIQQAWGASPRGDTWSTTRSNSVSNATALLLSCLHGGLLSARSPAADHYRELRQARRKLKISHQAQLSSHPIPCMPRIISVQPDTTPWENKALFRGASRILFSLARVVHGVCQ